MAEKTLGDAVNAFDEQFQRFKLSDQKPPVFLKRNSITGTGLSSDTPRSNRNRIADEYRVLLNPEDFYSAHSAIALQLNTDKQLLLQAYTLFKGLRELNRTSGDKDTFIAEPAVVSPLCLREKYTVRGEFGYLQAWLYFEAGKTDFVPVMKQQKENSTWNICFIPQDMFYPADNEREILETVRELFYSATEKTESARDTVGDGFDI